jgi:tetratricopeptide (TPR) repeat protein
MRSLIVILFAFLSSPIVSSFAFGQDFEKGLKLYDEGDFEKAITEFELLIENDASDLAAWYNLGLSYHRLKNSIKAKWAFEKAHLIEPGNEQITEQLEHEQKELNESKSWTSPFSQFEIMLLQIGEFLWSIFSIILALICSLFILLMAKKKQHRSLFGIISALSFLLMATLIYFAHTCQEIENRQYAIIKTDIESNSNIYLGERVLVKSENASVNAVEVILEDGSASKIDLEDLILL